MSSPVGGGKESKLYIVHCTLFIEKGKRMVCTGLEPAGGIAARL